MKKTLKLIPAIAMLLISAVMLSTATFAWFSMNASVTATGMTVKAQATSTLLIDTASTTNTEGRLTNGASTKDVTNASTGLMPTSTVNGTNWFYAVAETTSAKTAKTGTFGTVAEGDLSKYRLANTFYLQTFDATKPTTGTLASTGKKIILDAVTVTLSGGSATENLSGSFRVLVVCGDQKIFVSPTTTTEPTNNGVSSVSEGNATTASITFADVSDITSNKALVSTNNTVVTAANFNQVYTVNVYLYFDGEDTTCFTDNIPATLNDYTVAVQFSLADNA